MTKALQKDIEAVYPLSPMQQGMLFHSLYAPETGVYFEQLTCTLNGVLNIEAFERACQKVVDRNPILRTSFVWKKLDKMLQAVHARVRLPIAKVDWRGMPKEAQQERFEEYLAADRKQGFNLGKAPLIRLALLRTGETQTKFVWSHHHLLLDGWSMPLVFKEVFSLYEAYCRGAEWATAPGRPYRDYILWLQQQDQKKAEAYWRNALKGFEAPTPLVVERLNGHQTANQSGYKKEEIRLPLDTTSALQLLAQKHQVTLNTLIQGAWALLLHRYSGEPDVVFGSTVSGRPADLPGSENMIGLFINTLPVRVQVYPDASVLSWLKGLQARQAEMRDFEYSSLVDIQGWSDVPRSMPLFKSIIVFENYPVDAALSPRRGSLEINDVRSFEQTNYPITLVSAPHRELPLTIAYEERYFEAATIQRMLKHLRVLLTAFVDDPEQKVAKLALLEHEEKRQILTEWSSRQQGPVKNQCIHEWFEECVESAPDAIALVSEGKRVSYRELNQRANRLAHYLRRLGVGPESLVGICLERSVQMIVALLGVLKAGGAYLPLDPAYPKDRLQYMLADSGVSVLLIQQHLLSHLGLQSSEDGRLQVAGRKSQLPGGKSEAASDEIRSARRDAKTAVGHGPSTIGNGQSEMGNRQLEIQNITPVALDSDWHSLSQESNENPVNIADPDNLAYVIYTSGSTGKPKGVLLRHRGFVSFAQAMIEDFAVQPSSRVLQFASFSFDASVAEIFLALLAGGTLYLADRNTLLSQDGLTKLLRDEGITIITFPPSMLAMMPSDNLPDLKTVVSAGEACSWEVVEKWAKGRLFINGYGPTEATVGACWTAIEGRQNDLSSVPIGRPIRNVQAYLLDSNLNLVPVGVPGEVYIGGIGLARGYLNRPDLTAERFIPNPFGMTPGERLYRTGDLARYLPDGRIEFVGRVDHQVKIRGFRIELGEIETALLDHPDVRDAIVVAREDLPGQKRLVAYLTSQSGEALSSAELRSHVQARLPEYMIPSAFVTLEKFPLTPNGKVDRKALPVPEGSELDSQGYVAPSNQTEELVAGIWENILKTNRVGIHSNFFELGGHSLLATQLVSRLRDAFRVDVPIADVFATPTVADLARVIESLTSAKGTSNIPPLSKSASNAEPPLSFSQQRLWFLDQLQPGGWFYNIATAVRLTGKLNSSALQKSLEELVRRHESLRTTFDSKSGKPVQVIAANADAPLFTQDLSNLAPDARERELKRLAAAEAQKPFDLAVGPLFRATLVKLTADDHALLFTLHHIISDGWSMGVLVREFAELYAAFSQGKTAQLPELPIQYADFARWQREWLQGEELERQLSFWKEQLAGFAPVLDLPTDRPRPPMQTFNGAVQSFVLSKQLTAALQQLCRQEGVTLFMTLLAAFQSLLHRYSGQNDILVGSPIANRTRSEVEGLIGFFVNTLVLRADFTHEPTFRELLRQVRQTALGAFNHQDLPFEQLVETLQPVRDMSHSPLFQVAFILQNAPMEAVKLPDLTLSPVEYEQTTSKYDLTLTMFEGRNGLQGHFEYNTDLFDAATIERMAQHFQSLLQSVTAAPEQSVSAIPLMSENELSRMHVDWNATATSYPSEKCVHEWFEDLVQEKPDALAVTFTSREDGADQGHHLTYAQLNHRANQLANYLRKAGVGPEVLVGICVERSIEMMVGIMGVLKAGGAFVPMDPTYPKERLEYMLEDSGVRVLLSQQRLISDFEFRISESSTFQVAGGKLQDAGGDPKSEIPNRQSAIDNIQVIALDADWEVIAEEDSGNVVSGATPQNLAYVIYTSGSTGRPKGTMLRHQGLCNLATAQTAAFKVGWGSRIMQFSSLSFDASVWETVMALLSGSTLCLASREIVASGSALVEMMRQNRVTTITIPPSVLSVLPEESLPDLRTIITAGEACSQDLVQRWSPGRHFFNAYGPTETTVCASMHECTIEHQHEPPIGRPIANFQLYILDRHWRPVPIGVPGELHIGGVGLARGYLHRPDLTAEKFVPDPFGKAPGARLYKTGDLARYLPDGNVEFLGRIDFQVKVRGFRIELGEIESVLSQHPSLQDAVVIVREDVPGDKRLVGYLVAKPAAAPSIAELRSYLKARLPEYMVPTSFVTLEKLPLTTNGKVDRNALPAPDQSRPDLESKYVAPRNDVEEKIAAICAELLGLERVGIYDSFFDLGGHSLLATQFISRLREAFQVEIPLRRLFEKPTVAELADAIAESQAQSGGAEAVKIEKLSRGEKALEQLLTELDQLSDSEVKAMLADEKPSEY